MSYLRAIERKLWIAGSRHVVPLLPRTARQRTLAETLKRDLNQHEAASAEPSWQANCQRLRDLAKHGDPRAFLSWDVILRTMFVPDAPYVREELAFLRNSKDFEQWRHAMTETHAGLPFPYTWRPISSGNAIHHVYHLARLKEATGLTVTDFTDILEFGGGYGGMARVIHKLGFSGNYTILDLPEYSALQRYYLASANVPDVKTINDVADALLPDSSLFIATWSLSEAPVALRRELMKKVSGCKAFLIAYQDSFDGINNTIFFAEWRSAIRDAQWKIAPIKHIPGNSYLFGHRP